jgi:hypothetical protein
MAEWEQDEIIIKRRRPWGKVTVILLLVAACVGGLWFFRARILSMQPLRLGVVAEHVRSDVTGVGDSLDIVVSWHFTDSARGPQPDSARLEVGLEGANPTVAILPAKQLSDTLRIGGPGAGGTAMGHSCVSGVHGSRLSGESCTPWQFVRPGVQTQPPAKTPKSDSTKKSVTKAPAVSQQQPVLRLVVRPSGRQVDPDVGGKCAAWQRDNPGKPVWLAVNETAVPECMGPNGKPAVAQFCAFAVLQDGRRVKTENSTNNRYCDELYRAWAREQIS